MLRIIAIISFMLISGCNQPDAAEQKQEQTAEEKKAYAEKIKTTMTQQETMFEVTEDDIVFGDKDAEVTLIQYSSPTCPHCAIYHTKIFPQIKEKYVDTNKVRYVIREFIANKQDLDAVILAKCPNSPSRFVTFLNVLYDRQSGWAFNKKYREILTNIGQLGGISAEKYAQCLNDKVTVKNILNSSKLLSSRSDFEGTPVFYINGKKHTGAFSEEGLSKKLDELLAQ